MFTWFYLYGLFSTNRLLGREKYNPSSDVVYLTCMLMWECAQALLCSCLCACMCGCQSQHVCMCVLHMHACVGLCTGSSVFMSVCLYMWVSANNGCFSPLLSTAIFLLEIHYLPFLLILLFILKNSHFFLIFKIKIYCLKSSYVPIICSGQIHSTPPSSVFPFPPPLLLSPGFMSSLYNPLSPLEHGHPIRDCIYQKQSVANNS